MVGIPQPQLERECVNGREFIRGLTRGLVFWVNVPPEHAVGVEQHHAEGPTPFVIVSSDALHKKLPFVQGVPLTTSGRDDGLFRGCNVRIPASDFTYFDVHTDQKPLREVEVLALSYQARILAHERLLWGPAAKLGRDGLAGIEAGLKFVFGMPPV